MKTRRMVMTARRRGTTRFPFREPPVSLPGHSDRVWPDWSGLALLTSGQGCNGGEEEIDLGQSKSFVTPSRSSGTPCAHGWWSRAASSRHAPFLQVRGGSMLHHACFVASRRCAPASLWKTRGMVVTFTRSRRTGSRLLHDEATRDVPQNTVHRHARITSLIPGGAGQHARATHGQVGHETCLEATRCMRFVWTSAAIIGARKSCSILRTGCEFWAPSTSRNSIKIHIRRCTAYKTKSDTSVAHGVEGQSSHASGSSPFEPCSSDAEVLGVAWYAIPINRFCLISTIVYRGYQNLQPLHIRVTLEAEVASPLTRGERRCGASPLCRLHLVSTRFISDSCRKES